MGPTKSTGGVTLLDVVDRILEKGIVINADISITLVGVELLGIKIRAAVASFETAAKYGLHFPLDTQINKKVLQEAKIGKESCPECSKISAKTELLTTGCPWCGWVSARALQAAAVTTEL
jgi:ssDNA-binding Zn-finger/Zn-ribbon topoisomerase 1